MTIYDIITCQFAAVVAAYFLDLLLGDPNFALHPVRLMGKLIDLFEKAARALFPKTRNGEIAGGAAMAVFVIAVCGGVPFAILFFAYRYNMILGACIETIIGYFMLSARDLARSGRDVYHALLSGDVEEARSEVSMIVGRDTDRLDDAGIARAAVETVAENTSDGVVAPLFYMAIGGAVLGCVYKAINTMDSMVGYKNDAYINFGKFAARLDDAANFIPSRIAALLMIVSSFLLGFDVGNAAYIHKRDSRKHASPNSAQTESVAAGALRIMLGGDAYYFGKLHKKPTIGDDLRDIRYDNIIQTNRMMYLTSFLAAVIFLAAKFTARYAAEYIGVLIEMM